MPRATKPPRNTARSPAETPPGTPEETPEIIDHNEQGAPDDPLTSFLDAAGGAPDHSVRVYRYTPQGNREGVAVVPISDFDPMEIAEQWGGGRFRFQLIDGARTIRKTMEYRHVETSRRPDTARPPILHRPHGPRFPIYQDERPDPIAALIARVEELARRIDAPRPDSDRLNLRDLIPLLRPQETLTIRDLLPLFKERQSSPLGELLTAMQQLRQMQEENAGPSKGDDDGENRLVSQVIETLQQMGRTPAPPRVAPRPPAPPTAQTTMGLPRPEPPPAPPPAPAASASDDAQLFRLLAIGAASPNPDPAAYAQIAADIIGDDALWLAVEAGTDQLLTSIIETAPALEPHREFVAAVIEAARQMFAPEPQPDPPTPAPKDPPRNGTAPKPPKAPRIPKPETWTGNELKANTTPPGA